MCELLAADAPVKVRDTSFTAGMLSTVDAFLDMPLDEVVGGLALSTELRVALLGHAGPAGRRLRCAMAYERGDLERARAKAPWRADLNELYLRALAWAGEACGALLEQAAVEVPDAASAPAEATA